MARRLPSPPPVLAGFSHVRVLGSGGFADVFLYEQSMPRRQVAVKVLLREVVDDHIRRLFQAEADLMAQLSAHPSILTVYQAGVSSDGRPYMVMEYCSSVLSERYRAGRIPVPEILRIAVKIGSAIETAHRAGVLHRDLKPSNILLTAYGHPVLSDFGIATTLADTAESGAVGMSVPWTAPEVLADRTPGTVASEVWSFAATVYTLLAGRSPFEVPGGENRSHDLMTRIEKARVAPTGRPDVPASLERTLQRAMSRSPAARPASVLEVVRELQAVESELGVPQTAIEVAVDEWATRSVADLEDRTLVRALPSTAVPARPRRRRAVAPAAAEDPRASASAVPGAASRSAVPVARPSRVRRTVLATAAAVLAAAGVVAAVVLPALAGRGIPTVSDIDARSTNGGVEFSWPDPGLGPADTYLVQLDDGTPSVQSLPEFTTTAAEGDRVCLVVTVSRDGETGRPSGEKCVDVGA